MEILGQLGKGVERVFFQIQVVDFSQNVLKKVQKFCILNHSYLIYFYQRQVPDDLSDRAALFQHQHFPETLVFVEDVFMLAEKFFILSKRGTAHQVAPVLEDLIQQCRVLFKDKVLHVVAREQNQGVQCIGYFGHDPGVESQVYPLDLALTGNGLHFFNKNQFYLKKVPSCCLRLLYLSMRAVLS